MLQVTIDLVRHGDESQRTNIETLYIVNVGGDYDRGEYMVFDEDPRLSSGEDGREPILTVHDWPRRLGAHHLVGEILSDPCFEGVSGR